MYHDLFIHSSVDRHLGCFHVLDIVNSAAINIGVFVSFSFIVFSRYMPSSGIAGSYGGSIPSFFKEYTSLVAQMVKKLPANAGDVRNVGLIPESERSPGGGHGNPFQYSCLENPMDREGWRANGP